MLLTVTSFGLYVNSFRKCPKKIQTLTEKIFRNVDDLSLLSLAARQAPDLNKMYKKLYIANNIIRR